MNNIANVLKSIREFNRSDLPPGVRSIGWGPKVKDGIETGEYGVIFTVDKKKPLNELTADEILPSTFDIEEVICVTDVVEATVCKKLTTFCHADNPNIEPVRSNRLRRRPLMGGTSSVNIGSSDATLGLMVRDRTDGQIVALSNAHVYAASQIHANFKKGNELGSLNVSSLSARQPGTRDFNPYGNVDPFKDYIGTCKRSVVIGNIDPSTYLHPSWYNVIRDTSCDAAILQLSGYSLIDTVSSPNIVGFDIKAPYQFATDTEIDSLLNPSSPNYRSPIFRSGRTLGPIGFPGNTFSCKLSVFQFDTVLVGEYSGFLADFSNCFLVRGQVKPGAGGDSGSAMFALLSSNVPSASAWKLIGLLFAGPQDLSYTIGCRITNIVRDLNVVPWDCTLPSVSSSTSFINISSSFEQPSFSPTVVLSGRTYYQLGLA